MSHDYNREAPPYCAHTECRRETVAELQMLRDKCAIGEAKRAELNRAMLLAMSSTVAVRCRLERKPRPGLDGRSHAPLPS